MRTPERKFAVALLAAAASVAGACGTASSSGTHSVLTGQGPYSLSATKRCLHQRRAAVRAVPRSDPQKQAFRDLAQRTSLEASLGSTKVDLAFTRSAPDAGLLAELLRPPRGPYVVRVRKNAVVMHRTDAGSAVSRIIGCLR